MNNTPRSLAVDTVVIGHAIRTTANTAASDIGPHWARFMSELMPSLPPSLEPGTLYAVYTDYERDFSGAYSMVLGVSVASATAVPAGQRRVVLPAGPYVSFRAEGDPRAVIWKTWQHINGEWPRKADRRYVADFERYDTPTSPGSVRADVMVGMLVR